jgi:hypothetical protein
MDMPYYDTYFAKLGTNNVMNLFSIVYVATVGCLLYSSSGEKKFTPYKWCRFGQIG